MIDHNVQGWNALAYVLATTGTVGLVLFVLLVYVALRPQPALAIVFLLGMFADGTVLGPRVLGLPRALRRRRRGRRREPTAPAG